MSYPLRNGHPHTWLSVPLLRLLLRFPSVTPGIPFHCRQSPWYPQPLPWETWFFSPDCFLCSSGHVEAAGSGSFCHLLSFPWSLVRSPLRPRHHSHYVTLSSPVVIYWPPGLALYLWKLLATDPECSFSFQILPTSWPVWYVCEIFLTSQFLESISNYLFHSVSISQPHSHSQTSSPGNHSTGNTLAIQWLGPELARLWPKFDPWLGN